MPEPVEPENEPEDHDPERQPPPRRAEEGGEQGQDTRQAADPAEPGPASSSQPAPDADPSELSGMWLVTASGEMDTDTVGDLGEELEPAAGRYPVVILDLSGVPFGDSAFLSLLIRVQRVTHLRLVAPTPAVRQLFALTGTEEVLHIYGSIAEAIDG